MHLDVETPAFRCVSSCCSWTFLVHLDEHPRALRCVVSSGEATLVSFERGAGGYFQFRWQMSSRISLP